jgi:hypothetical protein
MQSSRLFLVTLGALTRGSGARSGEPPHPDAPPAAMDR